MLVSDSGRAIIVGIVSLLARLHLLQFWHLVLLSFLFGVVDGFSLPAYQSIQPLLVDKDTLQAANALTRLSTQISNLFGPTVGAVCIAISGPASAFALDTLSFVISAACLVSVHIPTATKTSEQVTTETQKRGLRGLLEDVREGLTYVTGSTWLWVTIAIASLANITYFGPIAVALPRLVHDIYHSGAWLLGLITTASATGAIIATLIIGQMRHMRRRGLIAYTSLLVSCLGLTTLGVPLPLIVEPVVAVIASVFMGLGLGVFEIIWVTVYKNSCQRINLAVSAASICWVALPCCL
jgi:MFS family permease